MGVGGGEDAELQRVDADALLLEAMVTARRDPAFREVFVSRLADEEGRVAQLLERGKADGLVDPTLSTDAIVTLCHAISFGFVVMGAIDKSVASADEWNQVIHRLVTAALPAPVPLDPASPTP